MNNELILLQLQSQLKSFGLNPIEWSLKPAQSMSYLIQHRKDQNFTFHGKIELKKKRLKWKSLELLSL